MFSVKFCFKSFKKFFVPVHLFMSSCESKMSFSSMRKLTNVEGLEGRINNVAYLPPRDCVGAVTCNSSEQFTSCEDFKGQVVFFPGDIQDFKDVMLKNHACRDFVDWSYENTLHLISTKFPQSHIWLISPSKKAYSSICIYKNFVKSESLLGVPSHTRHFNGMLHLEALLKSATTKVGAESENLAPDSPLVIIRFSKGCIVLNQFLYENSSYEPIEDNSESSDDSPIFPKPSEDFLKRIKSFIWLDGGHSGEKDVWVTDPGVISSLALTPLVSCKFIIHVTPYQVRDEHRPWKGESEAEFIKLLSDAKLNVDEKLHFDDENSTIDTHLKILMHF